MTIQSSTRPAIQHVKIVKFRLFVFKIANKSCVTVSGRAGGDDDQRTDGSAADVHRGDLRYHAEVHLAHLKRTFAELMPV